MSSMYIKRFADINIHDVAEVGGKNASLGEMIGNLSEKGIHVPDGFATTGAAFRYFLDANNLSTALQRLMQQLDTVSYRNLSCIGKQARDLIMEAVLPADLADAITQAYGVLCHGTKVSVAVRSSATAEDLPQASFAGQHESYLNVIGHQDFGGSYT
jgi:pyruvate, water dikinase